MRAKTVPFPKKFLRADSGKNSAPAGSSAPASRGRRLLWMLIALLLSALCGFLLELSGTLDWTGLLRARANRILPQSLDASGVSFRGCHADAEGVVYSDSNDPQLLIGSLDTYVQTVAVELSSPSSTLPVKIYYAPEEQAISEENTVQTVFEENRSVLFVDIDSYVQTLRIDIGIAAEDSFRLERITLNPSARSFLAGSLQNLSGLRIFLYALGSLLLLLILQNPQKSADFLYRYRWGLGAAFTAFCTLLKLHGSSIGILAEMLTGADSSRVFGTARYIRTDEYLVYTAMALSQAKSGFSWFSDIWGYSPSDMFIIYGQPVKNLVTLYRPFSAGYLLFGAERGLAFYWSARLAAGLLVSFEFGRILTKDDRRLSLAYAVLVVFSPLVQWWYSTNELVEMLIFGQGAVVLLSLYLREERKARKCLVMAGLVLCAGGYMLILYPAWMFPFFYAFLAAALAILWENRSLLKVRLCDLAIWGAGIAIFAFSFLYIWQISGDTITAVLNTVYPSNFTYVYDRLSAFPKLFAGWSSSLWSLMEEGNPCEVVCFVSFFPIGFLLAGIALFRDKVRDRFLILLGCADLLLLAAALLPLPEGVLSFLMLSGSRDRIVNAIGFLNLLLLFRAIPLVRKLPRRLIWLLPCSAVFAGLSLLNAPAEVTAELRLLVFAFALASCQILIHIDRPAYRNAFLVLCLGAGLIGGAAVNPVERGLDSIYSIPAIHAIETINAEEPGLWAATDNTTNRYSNLPAITGADTLTALATYPDLQLWDDLGLWDQSHTWNRYAHIVLELGGATEIRNPYVDQILLRMTVDDLRALGVRYVWSMADYTELDGLEIIYDYGGYRIWRVE